MNRKRIDNRLIEHLVWTPNKNIPPEASSQNPIVIPNSFSVDDFINGKFFYKEKLPDSLEKALEFAGDKGIVLTCPELIAAKVKTDTSHKYWQNRISVYTEENIGLDRDGNAKLVTIHGGGILTPQRIKQAYDEGLVNGSVKYKQNEFYEILEGRLLSGKKIPMFTYEEIKEGVDNLPHRFGVITPYNLIKDLDNTYFQKNDFIANPLAIARSGGTNLLKQYHDLAKDSDGDLGCYHPFKNRDLTQPSGRLLVVDGTYFGLCGDSNLGLDGHLSGYGRFVVVVPKTHDSATR